MPIFYILTTMQSQRSYFHIQYQWTKQWNSFDNWNRIRLVPNIKTNYNYSLFVGSTLISVNENDGYYYEFAVHCELLSAIRHKQRSKNIKWIVDMHSKGESRKVFTYITHC